MRVIDHAFRRCRVPAQKITAEMISTAGETLYLLLSQLATSSVPLWTIDKVLVAVSEGQGALATPAGTLEVLSVLSRNFNANANTLTAPSSTSAVATMATSAQVSTIGIVFGSAYTGTLSFYGSTDGLTFGSSVLGSVASASYVAGKYYWFELDTVLTLMAINVTGSSAISVSSVTLGSNASEIPLGIVARSDYENLPNKFFPGRPLQFWQDRQRDAPVLRMWPVPDATWAQRPLVITRRRHLMDVGTLDQTLDLPQRWYDAVVWQLAWRLAAESADVDPSLIPGLQTVASAALQDAMSTETDNAPFRVRPNIGVYTR